MKKIFTSGICLFFLLNCLTGVAQTTYTWVPAGGTGDWTVAANWSSPLPRTTPLPTDILVFNNGQNNTVTNVPTETIGQLLVNTNTAVTLQTGAVGTILTINGAAGTDVSVTTGSALNVSGDLNDLTINLNTGVTGIITGNMTFSATTVSTQHKLIAADANGITFNSPAIFTQGFRCTGNVFGSTGTNNSIVFNAGTVFVQNGGTIANANPFGAAITNFKVVFNTGSLYKHQQTGSPSVSGRTYGDFELNYATANIPLTGGNIFNVDNLTITAGQINLNLTGGINIKGNTSVAAGAILGFIPATAGMLNFNGATPQSITNNGTLTFGANEAVTINNAAGITLNSDITLQNQLTLTSGVISAPNPRVLTLSSAATVSGTSNASFVDGKVQKIGNTPFVFPVGKKTALFTGYVPLELLNPTLATVTDSYIVEYKSTSANALGAISAVGLLKVSGRDYWTVDRVVTNPLATADVRLYWTAESSGNGSPNFITDPLHIVVAHNNGTMWDTYGNTWFGTGTVVAGNVTWPDVSTFSPFALGSINFASPLPVIINYVNAKKENAVNKINWQVTCINNSVTFNIEKSGADKNFKTIAIINADAVRCLQPFDYADNAPLSGVNYYRLKTVDAAGKITYSSIISVLNSATGFDIVSLMPNIVATEMRLNLTAAQKTKLQVSITDVAGRPVQKLVYTVTAGSNQFDINVAHLAAGMYSLTAVTNNGDVKMVRFVKQ